MHIANDTHQRRFFSHLPVSCPEADLSILTCCKLIYTETYDCMRNAQLEQPPNIKLVCDEKNLGSGSDHELEFVAIQALRHVT